MTPSTTHDDASLTTGPLGSLVEQALGLTWRVHADPFALGLPALAGLALRDNPRRAQLVVSRVLAKHLPVAPAQAREAGHRLAALVEQRLGAAAPGAVVLGWCETATGLGQTVAEAMPGAASLHTTRRPDPALPLLAGFDEEHSHAVGHLVQPADPAPLLDADRALVLVDDELTTGTTALNTVEALHARAPRSSYVVAALLDLRPQAAREAFAERCDRLGVQVHVVALLDGELLVPDDVAERAADLRAQLAAAPVPEPPRGRGQVVELATAWPAGLPTGSRHGLEAGADEPVLDALDLVSRRLPLSGGPVLVVGHEELMWAPLRLADLLPMPTLVQTTTRSPVLAADLDGYAVRRVLHAPAPDEPTRGTRLHNVVAPGADPTAPAYDDVVLVVDTPAATARALADVLAPWAGEAVHVVALQP